MKKWEKIVAAGLVAVMALSVTACGGGNGGGSSEEPAPAESSETPDSSEAPDTSAAGEESAASGNQGGYTIGATYYTLQTEFCMRMDNYAKKYCQENGINYTSYDGNNDASTQLRQVETMITDGVDAIILNPQDADACVACVEAAEEAGIPVFGVNTMVNTDKLTSYVGSQDVGAGEEIMQFMIDHMGRNDFKIVVLEGPMGQSAQLQRWEGINNVLAENPDIEILAYDTANWSRSEAMTLMETWLTTHGDSIEAVVAENDEMALGARQAIEDGGYDIPCIGIDGITDAVAAVKEDRMIASDFQDAEGQISGAIDAAVKVLNGEEVEKEIWIPFQMITKDNVSEFENRY